MTDSLDDIYGKVTQPKPSSLDDIYSGVSTQASTPTPAPAPSGDGDFVRGFKRTLPELKQLGGGTMAAIGDVTGWDGLRDKGLEIYQAQERKLEPLHRDTDSASEAWKRVKQGDFGAGADFLQNAAGYTAGQALESLATAAAGAAIGGGVGGAAGAPAAGVGAVPGAAVGTVLGGIGGFVGKQAIKRGLKTQAEKLVAEQVAKGVAKSEAKKAGAEYLAKTATKDAVTAQLGKQYTEAQLRKMGGRALGAAAGAQGLNTVMELGSVYPEAMQQAADEGREMTGAEKARAVGAALAAAGVESAADLFNLGKLTRGLREAGKDVAKAGTETGLAGVRRTLTDYGKRAAVEVPEGMLREAGTEALQTGLERFGARQSLTDAEAMRDYIDSAAVGAVGGGMFGGAAAVRRPGMHERRLPDGSNVPDPNNGPLSRVVNTAVANGAIGQPLALPAPEGFTVGPDGATTRGIERPQVFAEPEMLFPQGRGMSAPFQPGQQPAARGSNGRPVIEGSATRVAPDPNAFRLPDVVPPWISPETGELLHEPTRDEIKGLLHQSLEFQVNNAGGISGPRTKRQMREQFGLTDQQVLPLLKEVNAERRNGVTAANYLQAAAVPQEPQVAEESPLSEANFGVSQSTPAGGLARADQAFDEAEELAAMRQAESSTSPATRTENTGNEARPDVQPAQAQGGVPSEGAGSSRPTPAPASPQVGTAVAPVYDDSPDVLDTDITPPSGGVFENEGAAAVQARRVEGGRVVPVDGGFVVRTPATPTAQTPDQATPEWDTRKVLDDMPVGHESRVNDVVWTQSEKGRWTDGQRTVSTGDLARMFDRFDDPIEGTATREQPEQLPQTTETPPQGGVSASGATETRDQRTARAEVDAEIRRATDMRGVIGNPKRDGQPFKTPQAANKLLGSLPNPQDYGVYADRGGYVLNPVSRDTGVGAPDKRWVDQAAHEKRMAANSARMRGGDALPAERNEPKQPGVPSPTNLPIRGEAVSAADLIAVKNVYGKTVHVHKDVLASDRKMLPMYASTGRPLTRQGSHQTIVRDNLDADGSKRRIGRGLPYYAHTTKNGERGFKTSAQAERAVTDAGQSMDDYEIQTHGGGFVAVRKQKESAGRQADADQKPLHVENGEAIPATPAEIARSAKVADSKPKVTMAEAKKDLLAQIDEALKTAPEDTAEPIVSKPRTQNGNKTWDIRIDRTLENDLRVPTLTIVERGSNFELRHGRNLIESFRTMAGVRHEAVQRLLAAKWDDNKGAWDLTQLAPLDYITFDVEGDGSFKVLNTRQRLESFRAQVDKFFKLSTHPVPRPESMTVSDAARAKIMAEAETIADAAHEAATSPKNDLPAPTDAQKEAGNYQKGHIRFNGFDISIENPAGSKRSPEWPELKNHYGYFRGTIGKDKDHVDVFMTDHAQDADRPVFVVDQVNKDGSFDEHKVIMGAADEAEARKVYLQNYEKGWTGLGAITQMSQDEFKAWLADPKKTKRPAGKLATQGKENAGTLPKGEGKESQGTNEPMTPSVKGSKTGITDSGEQLRNNNRNRYGGVRWQDVEGLNDTARIKAVTREAVWPDQKWEALVKEEGLVPYRVLAAKLMRSVIPKAPVTRGVPTDADLRAYIEAVTKVRDVMDAYMRDPDTGMAPGQLKDAVFQALMPNKLAAGRFVAWEKFPEELHALRLLGSNKFLNALQRRRLDQDALRSVLNDGWPDNKQEAWERRFKIRHSDAIPGRRISRPGDGVYGYYITRKQSYSIMAGPFVTEDEAINAAREMAKPKRTGPEEKGLALKDVQRIGAPRRDADATPDQLRETFGFRGVNFGNWVNQKERQAHLNHAYDAFSDLADLLGIPPRAISLNGMLGIAFGAQGKGKAAAHFVPGDNEINITKTAGAGALAHEWGHALDHYFAVMDGPKSARAKKPFLTNLLEKADQGGTRREVVAAFREVVDAMQRRELTPEELAAEKLTWKLREMQRTEYARASGALDAKRSKPYWSTPWEMFARALELYSLQRLADAGSRNDYLTSPGKLKREAYPQGEDAVRINNAFDKLFKLLETRETERGTALFSATAHVAGRRPGLGEQEVRRIAERILGVAGNADQGVVPLVVVGTTKELPQPVQNDMKAGGVSPDEVRGVHWGGKSYLVAANLPDRKAVEEVTFHEHYAHGGLRAKYGKQLVDVLNRLAKNVGGLEGIRKLAREQGIDLSKYEDIAFGKKAVPEQFRLPYMMEELLAHTSQTTGTLRRIIEEFVGAVRAWLRDSGFAALADYGVTDLAHVLKQAREAAQAKTTRAAPRYSTAPSNFSLADTFRSALVDAVEAGKGAPKRATAEQWKGWLDGAQRRGEFRQTERDWMGVDDWLAQQGRVVTREALADFVRANQVQVQDVVLGESKESENTRAAIERRLAEQGYTIEADPAMIPGEPPMVMRGDEVVDAEDLPDDVFTDVQDWIEASDEDLAPAGSTKFGSYQLPGGENYRELLLTLPTKDGDDPLADKTREELGRLYEAEIGYNPIEDDPSISTEQLREDVRSLGPAAAGAGTSVSADISGASYQSVHFDQPNILAHVRFNERTDADGKRVLFLEEIQSDWHQAGRKRGYAQPKRSIEEIEADRSRLNRERNAVKDEAAALPDSEMAKFRSLMAREAELRRELMAVEDEWTESVGTSDKVPNAPFKATDEWAMLAFKRMVRWAAENGFERIAWTTGAQQADRYDLSKQVDKIEVVPRTNAVTDEKSRVVYVHLPSGQAMQFGVNIDGVIDNVNRGAPADAKGKRLDELLGKEIADRIMSTEGAQTFSGEGLKVGGEGMKSFYDKILPAAVNKWAKRFGGKVGSTKITVPESGIRFEDRNKTAEERGVYPSVHSIEITPDMRAAALGGLPLFSADGRARGGLDISRAQELKRDLTAKWGPDAPSVMLVEDASGFPETAKVDPNHVRAEGFYDGKPVVWLNLGMIRDEKRFAEVLAHEALGHYGVESIVGEKEWGGIVDAVDRLRKKGSTNPKFAAVLADVQRRYGQVDRVTFAKEVIAVMAERGMRNSWVNKVLAAVQRWVRKYMPGMKWNERDLLGLLGQAESFLHRGPNAAVRAELVQSYAFSRGVRSAFEDAGNFARSVRAVVRGESAPDEITVTQGTPDVFAKLGLADRPFTMLRSKMLQVMKEHPEITEPVLQQLVRHLHEPVAVFQSGAGSTNPNGLVVLTELEIGGKPVMIALHMGVARKDHMVVNRVASYYGKDSREAFLKSVGPLRYLDQSKTPAWLPKQALLPKGSRADTGASSTTAGSSITGLQLPRTVQTRSGGTGATVLTDKDVVKPFTSGAGAYSLGDAPALFSLAPADSDPAKSFEEITERVNLPSETALEIAKSWAANKWVDFKPTVLKAIQLPYFLELGARWHPQMKQYEERLQRMAGYRNNLIDVAGSLAQVWQDWSYVGGWKGLWGLLAKQTRTARQLDRVLHDATQLGIDPSKEYTPTTWADSRGKRHPYDRDAINERIKALQGQIRGRGGDSASNKQAKYDEINELKGAHAREKRKREAYPKLVARYQALAQGQKEFFYTRGENDRIDAVFRTRHEAEEALRRDNRSGQVESAPAPHALFQAVRDYYETQHDALEAALIARVETMELFEKETEPKDAKDITRQQIREHEANVRKSMIASIRLEFENQRLDGIYVPLNRDGDWWMSAKNDEGEYAFVMRETARQAEQAEKVLKAQGFTIEASGRKGGKVSAKDAVPGSFAGELMATLKEAHASENVQDEVYQLLLKALPEMSVRKHRIHRKNVAGYGDDALRAFAKSGFHGAHELARVTWSHQLQMDIDAAQKAQDNRRRSGDLSLQEKGAADAYLNEWKARHEWAMSPRDSTLANKLSSLNFVMYLGMSPAAALVNLMQVPQVTLPVMAARHGAKAGAELMAAMRDVTRTRMNVGKAARDDMERDAIRALTESGHFTRTMMHALAGLSEGDRLRMNPGWAKTMHAVGWMFQTAEEANRKVTGLAAFRLARAKGESFDAALRYAQQMIDGTHGDYSNASRPEWMRGPVFRTIFQFKTYGVFMVTLLGDSFYKQFKGETPEVRKEAMRTFWGIMGMTSLLAGTMGTPIYSTMSALASALVSAFGDDDDPWDADVEFRKWLDSIFGESLGRALAKGLPSMFGMDLSSRVGLEAMLFRGADREMEGVDAYHQLLETLVGPVGGLAKNQYRGLQMMGEGKVYRAIETMSPKFTRDALRAGRFMTEGATSMRGDPVLEDIKGPEGFMQVLGFTPSRLAEQYEENRALKNYEQHVKDRRAALMNAFALSRRLDDSDLRQRTLQQIAAFNKRWPEIAITPAKLRASLRQRAAASARADNGVIVDRRLREQLRQAVGVRE